MRITALHLHPIKGCHRVEVDRAVVSPYGLVGDREWQVIAPDGGFLTQRQHPQLTRVRPEVTDDGLVLRAEGMDDLVVTRAAAATVAAKHYTGETVFGDAGDEAAEWMSTVVGEPVRLVGIAPGYERNTGLFATESNLGDAAPVLIANDASHAFLLEHAIEEFATDRWRANIWIDADAPWVEDTWRQLRIGEATVSLVLPWPRCAVPQVDQDDGTRHREPALVLKAHRWCSELPPDASPIAQAVLKNQPLFGMGSAIEPAGAVISVGDEVVVVETGPALL